MIEESLLSESSTPKRIELKRHPQKDPILEASLVLASQSIRHWIEFDGEAFILTVLNENANSSQEILRKYESENVDYQIEVPHIPIDLYLSPLLYLLIPVAVFFWSNPWHEWLTKQGGANAKRILEGEWWRCITATSLHVDHEHFLSNMLSGFFILNLLRRRIGPGNSMITLTVAASLTNFAVAYTSLPEHNSIGFSSVVFAALGLLAGLETLNLPKQPFALRQLSPIIAAFFLAVMVGLGEKVDVKAHFYGFGMGVVFSPLAKLIEKRLGAPLWQTFGVVMVYSAYGFAWLYAQR